VAQLNISLPDEDLATIRRSAREAQTPISQYVRSKVLDDVSYGPWADETEELRSRIDRLEDLARSQGAAL
jgi:hypothetical protein